MPFQILEHTADFRMKVEGKSFRELLTSAFEGMMKTMKEHPTEATAIPAEKKVGHHISTEASDPTALLIDFLNEILTLAHVNKEAYTDIQWEKLSNTALNVIVRGVKVDAFDRDIKAVTFHQAEVRQNPNGIWETLLVFDI